MSMYKVNTDTRGHQMRRVMNGKMYDTETAREVGYWYNARSGSDYRNKTLYRKRTGEYFFHTQHGEYDYRENIVPTDYETARAWAAENLEAEDYEREFGTPDEGGTHDLHVTVSDEAWKALTRRASKEGVTVRAIIERIALAPLSTPATTEGREQRQDSPDPDKWPWQEGPELCMALKRNGRPVAYYRAQWVDENAGTLCQTAYKEHIWDEWEPLSWPLIYTLEEGETVDVLDL